MNRNNWRKSAAVFHDRAAEYDSWFEDSLVFDIEVAAIQALEIPELRPALEIGVGPGRFASTFSSDFGIDPANAPLHLAAARNIKVCQAVGEALPFATESFKRISIFFTLCFVQDPSMVLQECYRVLKTGGNLILGFVPANSPWGKALLKKKEAGHPFYEHARFFSTEACETLILNNGFTIINTSSSLYQKPGNVYSMETPRAKRDNNAGFTALTLQKETR